MDSEDVDDSEIEDSPKQTPAPSAYEWHINWPHTISIISQQVLGYGGFFYVHSLKWSTFWYGILLMYLVGIGLQIGGHRLWSHRSFKACLGLRIGLAFFQTMGLQHDLHVWASFHRLHHRWVDTDADPHNAKRGVLYSHVGWLIIRPHPEVRRRMAELDLSDLEADPVVTFQRRWYLPLALLFGLILPPLIPVFCFGETSILGAVLFCNFTRILYVYNLFFAFNSVAHKWGTRPYDSTITPVEPYLLRHLLNGEGFHNYHHAFPWDYSTSELGPLEVYNPMTVLVDFFAYMGWAWDLKRASPGTLEKKVTAKGDLTAYRYQPARPVLEWCIGVAANFAPITIARCALMWYLGVL